MYQPFMDLWMGRKGPEYMYPTAVVALFVLYFFVNGARRIVMIYKDALGMWHSDRWKSIVGAAVNFTLNVTLVQIIGVSGVIISTIISYLFVEMPWETHVLYKYYFEETEIEFYIRTLKSFAVTALVGAAAFAATSVITLNSRLLTFLAATAVTITLTLLLIYLIYRKDEDFQFVVDKLKQHFVKA